MEGFLNGTIQDSQKVETQSLSEDKKVAVEVDDSQDGDIVITDKEEAPQSEENKVLVEAGKVEETQEDVAVSVAEPDTVKDAQVENTVESDTVMLEFHQDFESDPDVKEAYLYHSVSENEGMKETEVVETAIVKDITVTEEEGNVVSHAVSKKLLGEVEEANDVCDDSSLTLTDVASGETAETSVPKSCESDKVAPTIIEKSLDMKLTLDEEVQESSGGIEDSSHENAKEYFQPSPSVVPDAESNENPVGDSHLMIVSYRHFSLC